jgi:hypothetical protein
LISCASRRPIYPAYGEIESLIPGNQTTTVMIRTGEPATLIFKPHGISLIQVAEIQYLFVITHDDQNQHHPIVQYQVDGDTLHFVRLLDSPLLVSPNALQAYPDGSLLVCNDAANRNNPKEKIFRQKKGNIIGYDGHGNWSILARNLGMPAGLAGLGNQVFVSAALENIVYQFLYADGALSGKTELARIKGPDNIRWHNGKLLITSHSKPIKFIIHTKNPTRKSPSGVFSLDPQTGEQSPLFHDKGSLISAASVAIILRNQLFIGQIFEPFIATVSLDR